METCQKTENDEKINTNAEGWTREIKQISC